MCYEIEKNGYVRGEVVYFIGHGIGLELLFLDSATAWC